mmetsp:Transcript_5916/g.19590  ORF Transcript_5916/g.19590 Transcript_5916/m.19590 type:complete len:332 (-) Transcript_5916:1664-2659(-)
MRRRRWTCTLHIQGRPGGRGGTAGATTDRAGQWRRPIHDCRILLVHGGRILLRCGGQILLVHGGLRLPIHGVRKLRIQGWRIRLIHRGWRLLIYAGTGGVLRCPWLHRRLNVTRCTCRRLRGCGWGRRLQPRREGRGAAVQSRTAAIPREEGRVSWPRRPTGRQRAVWGRVRVAARARAPDHRNTRARAGRRGRRMHTCVWQRRRRRRHRHTDVTLGRRRRWWRMQNAACLLAPDTCRRVTKRTVCFGVGVSRRPAILTHEGWGRLLGRPGMRACATAPRAGGARVTAGGRVHVRGASARVVRRPPGGARCGSNGFVPTRCFVTRRGWATR